jgi:hypothetical protein
MAKTWRREIQNPQISSQIQSFSRAIIFSIQFRSKKRSFSKKTIHFPPPDHCAPVITKIRYDPGARETPNFFLAKLQH